MRACTSLQTLVATLWLGGALLPLEAQRPTDAEETRARIAEVRERRAGIRSFAGTQSVTMEAMGRTIRTGGPVWFRAPARLRLEMQSDMPTASSLTVFDGETTWTYQAAANMVARIDVAALRQEFPEENLVNNTTYDPFQGIDAGSLRFLREDVVDGEAVYLFRGESDGRAARMGMGQMAPDWMEISVGVADGLLRRLVAYRASGEEMMRGTSTIESTNTDLPDSLFLFEVPEGAQMMDMTASVRGMLAQQGAPKPPPVPARTPARAHSTPPPAGDFDVATILDELTAAREALTTWQGETRRDMQMMGTTVTQMGREWHGGEGRTRQEMTMSTAPGTTVSVQDSSVMWTWMPMMKIAQRIDRARVRAEEGEEEDDGTKPERFEGIVRDSVVVLGRESFEGTEVYRLAGPAQDLPKGLGLGEFGRVELRIGLADGLVRERIIFDAKGNEAMRVSRTGVQVDVDLPDSLFTFTPPEGAQVMDLTETVLNQVRQRRAQE